MILENLLILLSKSDISALRYKKKSIMKFYFLFFWTSRAIENWQMKYIENKKYKIFIIL